MQSTYKQIADEMQVNKITVRRHLQKIEQDKGKSYTEQHTIKIKDTVFLSEELTEQIKNSIREQNNSRKGCTSTCTSTDKSCTSTVYQYSVPVHTDTVPVHTDTEPVQNQYTPVQAENTVIDLLKAQNEEQKRQIQSLYDQLNIKDLQIQRLNDQLAEMTTVLKQQQQINALCISRLETHTAEEPAPEQEQEQEKPKGIFKIFRKGK